MRTIEQYYKKIEQEVKTRMLASEDGGTKEQIFTRMATDLMKRMSETDNVSISYDEKSGKVKNPHKINAFSISDDLQTLDLFVSKFYVSTKLVGMTHNDMLELKKLVCNFYRKAVEEEYALHIAESSEIFDCAHEIGYNEEFRANLSQIRVFILTNADYSDDDPEDENLCGTPVTFQVIDINHLYRISEEADAPVNVNFAEWGGKVPCITEGEDNDVYQVYVAIMPGIMLSDLYKEYGVKLMENNVRQFLQFTGKINKGIKDTIDNHPEMFLAYNNGIAATAKKITLDHTGRYITSVEDFQIVNGGQTTASLYHAKLNNPNADLSRIYVQVKLSVIKADRYDDIVGQISRCANTQNKVNEADFSANDERLIQFEKMSRYIMTPETKIHPYATYWFFERAKGQYKNFRLKDGFTRQREKQFDMKYPKEQMFTKVDLAKYINAYDLMQTSEGKYAIGPHIVCKGNEKCYEYFRKYNMPSANEIDNIYYEDAVAKAILFKEADRRYGTKSSGEAIGDLKKTVVPYTIALLRHITEGKIDLYKIWRAQMVSEGMSDLLYEMMKEINQFILDESPYTRYEEWGKKEECWEAILENDWYFNTYKIQGDLIDPKSKAKRKSTTKTDDEKIEAQSNRDYVEAIPAEIWEKTAVWGEESGLLNLMQQIATKEICRKMHEHIALSDSDIEKGLIISDILAKNNINLLYEADSFAEEKIETPDRKKISFKDVSRLIDDDLMERMYEWNQTRNILKKHVREAIENAIEYGEAPQYKMKWAIYYGLLDLEARGFKR